MAAPGANMTASGGDPSWWAGIVGAMPAIGTGVTILSLVSAVFWKLSDRNRARFERIAKKLEDIEARSDQGRENLRIAFDAKIMELRRDLSRKHEENQKDQRENHRQNTDILQRLARMEGQTAAHR